MNFVKSEQIRKHIKKNDMQYFVILGMRSNGKSCAVKKYCLEEYLKNGKKLFYIRRYQTDLNNWKVESYFENVPGFSVPDLTDGKWESVTAKQGKLFLSKTIIERGKAIKVLDTEHFGYIGSLSDSEHLKSLNFPGCANFIFEEFITDKVYLPNESTLLFNVVSTVFRNDKGCVFLVGNTISEVNPYFREFQLDKISTQRQGTLDIYLNDQTKIAVWLTSPMDDDREANKMSFGEVSRMIKKGEWQRSQKRHLEKPIDQYNVIYSMVFKFHDKMFLMQLLENGGSHVWFVQPKTTEIQKGSRIISDGMIEADICTIGFIPLNQNESRAFNILKQGKIAYSDNLTGTQFIQCYQQMERGIQ